MWNWGTVSYHSLDNQTELDSSLGQSRVVIIRESPASDNDANTSPGGFSLVFGSSIGAFLPDETPRLESGFQGLMVPLVVVQPEVGPSLLRSQSHSCKSGCHQFRSRSSPLELSPVLDDSGAYQITPDGVSAYGPRHFKTCEFYEGRAGVYTVDGQFHIPPKGNPAYSEIFSLSWLLVRGTPDTWQGLLIPFFS